MQHCWRVYFGRFDERMRLVIVFARKAALRDSPHKIKRLNTALLKHSPSNALDWKEIISASSLRRRFLLVTDLESINNCIMSRCPFFYLFSSFFAAIIRHFTDERIFCRSKKKKMFTAFAVDRTMRGELVEQLSEVGEVHVHVLKRNLFALNRGGTHWILAMLRKS